MYNGKRRKHHRKITDWARQMMLLIRHWYPDRSLVFVSDSTYSIISLLLWCQSLSSPVTLITRLRLDAALYEPAPTRMRGQMGRPRLKGKRLPTLARWLDGPNTNWMTLTVPSWYGGEEREVEIVTDTAVWYHAGKLPAHIRWVLVRDPLQQFKPLALLSTELHAEPSQMLM